MTTDAFITILQSRCNGDTTRQTLGERMPLGIDDTGELIFARGQERVFNVRNTCVTGSRKTAFIKRLVLTLSRLYTKDEANFLILSPYAEYGELLSLQDTDVTVPYIRDKAQLQAACACISALADLYKKEKRCLKLFLILDGLDELEGCNLSASLEEYREIFDLLSGVNNAEIISGVELMKSIFSGYPGAFVGFGNCLVTTREHGKADVTFVGEDASLSLPMVMTYPDLPTVQETIMAFKNQTPWQE